MLPDYYTQSFFFTQSQNKLMLICSIFTYSLIHPTVCDVFPGIVNCARSTAVSKTFIVRYVIAVLQRLEVLFLHTMPGYCYLTPGWDITIFHPTPLLRLCQSYPTLPNYFFMTTTRSKRTLTNYLLLYFE